MTNRTTISFSSELTQDCRIIQTKVILVVCMMLSALMLEAQEPNPIADQGMTNIVKTPIASRSLYQKKIEGSGSSSKTKEESVMHSLLFFKKTQNPDGSWGDDSQKGLVTPLVLLSYLGHGETSASCRFSNTVTRAREWIMKSNPTGTAQRLVTITSLSVYCDLTYVGTQPDQKTNELAKINLLLAGLKEADNGIWGDFVSFHTMPSDVSKPSWMRRTKAVEERYRSVSITKMTRNTEDYLQDYLASLANFHRGGKLARSVIHTSAIELMNRQLADGSYPVSCDQDRFSATAVATMQLQIHFQYEPREVGSTTK